MKYTEFSRANKYQVADHPFTHQCSLNMRQVDHRKIHFIGDCLLSAAEAGRCLVFKIYSLRNSQTPCPLTPSNTPYAWHKRFKNQPQWFNNNIQLYDFPLTSLNFASK